MTRRIEPICAALLAAALSACEAPPPAAADAAAPAAGASARAAAPASAAATVPGNAAELAAAAAAAEKVVRDYYAAIDAHDYATAYSKWGDGGADSGQTYDQFSHGYANTVSVEAKVGKAHGHEGAAGSQYILVPVQLAAKQTDGSVRRYEGDMALRKVVADGASAAERRWHLHEGRITRLPDTH